MNEKLEKNVNRFIKINDGKEYVIQKSYEKKNPTKVEFKEIDSKYLDIYYDYSSYTAQFIYSLFILLIIMPIAGYIMFIFFRTSIETIIFAIIVIIIIHIIGILYVKFHSFEFIFDKENDTFIEIKTILGKKREEYFKVSEIEQLNTEKIYQTFEISILMKDKQFIKLYHTQDEAEANDFASEVKNFLNI
ncbi:MAG: hypothetical protein EAX96_18800 [Candidatus Lokiarchaeota archaeon]|nr:hypothetical protein [Candidatus Lokiarchaeota archaeon]